MNLIERTRNQIRNTADTTERYLGQKKDHILQQTTVYIEETKDSLGRRKNAAAIGTRRYLASVVNRTIGREAWNHALQNPTEDDLNIKVSLLNLNYYPIDPERPKHKKKSRGLITLFDKYNHRAAVFGVWQAIAPSTFRFFEPVLYNDSSAEDRLKNDKKAAYFESAKFLAAIATDTAILGAATWLSQDSNNNLPAHSFVAWKLAGNAAFHTSLDLIDATFEGTGRLSNRVNTATQTSIERLSITAQSLALRLDNSPAFQRGCNFIETTAAKARTFEPSNVSNITHTGVERIGAAVDKIREAVSPRMQP